MTATTAKAVMITAHDKEVLVVEDLETNKTSSIDWPVLAILGNNGLKYRSECISYLLMLVEAGEHRKVEVSKEAEKLIKDATEIARLLKL